MNLLCRFYDTTSGTVRIDGKDVRNMDLYNLRDNIGMAMQDVFLFSDTIEGNIAYGRPNSSFEDVKKAAKMADANLFIQKMPEGYDTIVGERGVGLSGGQKQRVAIVRSLAMKPDVILFDEPTSALDPISTSKIEDLAMELKKKYTIVIVTHNMQQAARISDQTAFFLLGNLIEYNDTEKLFANPNDKRTEDYITGRFG